MNYPSFFNEVEPIEMIDPLADLLGVVNNGIVTYNYIDIVKLAGHSCPTVAGAWVMCKVGLKELYKDRLPTRGNIKVELKGKLSDGTAGVVGSCIGMITGAANEGGFKGINGMFARNNRLFYGVEMEKEVRLTRLDDGLSVELGFDASAIPPLPEQKELMQKIMQGIATVEEKDRFGELWQERVKKILLQTELWSDMVI